MIGNFALPTKTELIGQNNAILFQVFIPGFVFGKEEDILFLSQVTTITEGFDGQIFRTRIAQSFDTFANFGVITSLAYYRERKVEKDEFYSSLEKTIAEYNIREEDLCSWDNSGVAIDGIKGSLKACKAHLEESFTLGSL